ncbi:amidohydrolase [Ilumatobacter coccineus]|uniref:Putative hydrolase n=1 Tax=Ilumatobacter coccineus (strain NBRC 103263 / KCTC 29153 / YM16-304) TaxID=1313172 RepID=A0A6C7EGJ7_ILUCY|nr:amidohydrolase [Ilumatobacter coccineus]BAN03728.1 putative hydrolase [Ilumatobacter coccineus YM16-304]
MSGITIHTAAAVVTVSDRCPAANAVAVRGDRIVAVGMLDDVIAALADEPYDVDESCAGRVILPGLIDQHLHPILGATTLATEVIATEDWVLPDVTHPAAHSHEEYVERLRAADGRLDPDEWLFSWGYHELWHGELSREILDSVNDTRPIGVWQRSCHEFYLNTPALQQLGLLDRDLAAEVAAGTLDAGIADTASIERGHFWERGNFVLVFPLVTPILFEPGRFINGLQQMVRYLHQNGVTAFNEPGAILVPGAWELYEAILGADDTPFSSFFLTDGRGPAEQGMSHDDALARAERELAMAPTGKVRFFEKQVKLFADGAIISQLMQMSDPYLDRDGNPNPHHHGTWLMEPDVFDDRAKLYWDHGFQLHIHVNGDAGLDMVLDTIERRMRENPRPDHRTVIVHFANSTEDQVDRIARLGCVVSSNPYYPVGFADKFGEVGLGSARADVMTRHRSVLDRNIPLSFHSDLPMGRSDPIGMMSCAVNRVTQSGRVAGPEQRITIAEALRAVTIDAAQSWRLEHELGSIEPGKLANFTVVDRNPLDSDPEALDDIDVVGTFYEGRWYPVPAGGSRRDLSVGRSSARRQHRANLHRLHAAGTESVGCICSVAHELGRAS